MGHYLLTPAPILACLRGHRFSLDDEKSLQVELADVFLEAGLTAEREVRLTAHPPHDIIDFMIDFVGVEVKIKGSTKEIYRQCMRYCNAPRVQALVVITNKIVRLPPALQGVPVAVFNLGLAWL